ncbi:glycosyltransferase [soil metagenome]
MRVAAHISASEWGGAERRSLILLAGLAELGHDVTVYCNTERIADRARAHGLDAAIRPLGGDVRLDHALALAATLRRQRPDVLILITFRRLWLGALAARLAGVPRVIARIGLASDVVRNVKYRVVLQAWIDDVVVNAHALEAPFVASLPPRSRARVHVIPNGVTPQPATLDRPRARRQVGIPDDAFVVGCVARIVKQKRIDRLLHAVADTPRVHALIVGDGALLPAMRALAGQLDIAERVWFAGHREDVGSMLAACDAYAVASDREGMSSGMLEALAAGLPVVSTPVSGAHEALLGEPACGIVVDFHAAAMSAAFTALREQPDLRAQLAAAAAVVARNRYSTDGMIRSWHALLTA